MGQMILLLLECIILNVVSTPTTLVTLSIVVHYHVVNEHLFRGLGGHARASHGALGSPSQQLHYYTLE